LVGTTAADSARLNVVHANSSGFIADLRSQSSSFNDVITLIGSNTTPNNGQYSHIRCDHHGFAQKFKVLDNGNCQNSNNSYGSLSDERIKENITDSSSQWDDIKNLKIRKYNRIGSERRQIGVIAQELESEGMGGLVEETDYFDVVSNPNDEPRKSVKYSVLYMKAVKALQEAMNRIETLEAEVASLKNA